MAEIQPLDGPGGTPGEAPTVLTAPVDGGPRAGEAPPPSRPAGLARWGVALLVLAVTVGVVSVAAALLTAGGSASAVQGWLPGNTVLYVEGRADLPGDQRANVGNILAKFPGFADQSSLDAKIDEALDRLLESSGVSWSKDVKPWLGGEVGYAITSSVFDVVKSDVLPSAGSGAAAMPSEGLVALLSVKDGAAAKAWVAGKLGGTQTTEQYAGGDITLVSGLAPSTRLAYAVRGDVMLLGPEKTVKAALDTGGKSSLASSASFAAARKSAPDANLGFAFVDLKSLVDGGLALGGDSSSSLPKACLDAIVAGVPAWASGSARAEADTLVFAMTSAASAGAGTAGASAAASHLPGTTVAAVEVRDLGPGIVAGLAGLKTTLACDPSTAATIDQLEQALAAVGGADALVGWVGDAALAVEYAGGTFDGGLAAVVTDEAAAGRTLEQLQSLVALGGSGVGITSRTEAYGDGQLLVVTIPSDTVGAAVPEIAATVQRGVFALGTIDFVKHVVDTTASSSLAGVDAYRRAIKAAGGDGRSDVYVDIAGIRAAAEAMLPADQKARYETEIKPFLEPLEAFAAVAGVPGATTVSRAVVTFTK